MEYCKVYVSKGNCYNYKKVQVLMKIVVVKEKITVDEVKRLASESYGEMVKAVVDIENGILAIGGEWHADAEVILLQQGSKQDDLWGFNIYPGRQHQQWIEFVSLINIRPRQNNRKMEIEDAAIREKISHLVNKLVD